MDTIEDNEYLSFLQSLDDSQFVLHVNSLDAHEGPSQRPTRYNSNLHENIDIIGHSTPLVSAIEPLISITSTSTDPFDDGLDDVLLGTLQSTQEDVKDLETPLDKVGESSDEESHNLDSLGSSLEQHKFGDYATYFHNKLKKQRKQDAKFVEWDHDRRKNMGIDATHPEPIFGGCVIHVNGHTVPSINEIHRLVILHGGQFLSFLHNKGAATHVICDRLTPRKKLQFKNYKVVKAQWITDSVAQQRILNWQDYRLIEDVSYGQKRLDFNLNHQSNDLTDDLESEFKIPPISQPENALEDDYLQHLQSNNFVQEPVIPDREVNDFNSKIIMDAKNPEFLLHFFSNSRLHHLSTWKADLRLRFLRRVIKENKTGKHTHTANQSPYRTIMHIDFDCFFATASCLKHPELDILNEPIAVSHGGRTSDVASCNYVARLFGIKNGMWLGQAKKLCPKLHVVGYEFDTYEKSSNEFYDYLMSYEIFDSILPVLIDECLIDVSTYCARHSQNNISVIESLCTKIRSDVYDITQCPVSIGASRNILLAKLALRKAKPNNLFYLHEKIEDFLSDLPVTNLPGIGRNIEHKLGTDLMEVDEVPRVRHVLQFGKMKLTQVFGEKTGAKLYEYARGIDNAPVGVDTTDPEQILGRKSVSVDVNFGIRFDTVEELDNFFMRLARELYSRLISLRICGSRLTLKLAKRAPNAAVQTTKYLGMGVCEFSSKSSNLGVATNDWGIIGSEIKSLYRMINIPPKELRGISVSMTKLEDVDNVKTDRQTKLPFNQVKDFNPFSKTNSELSGKSEQAKSTDSTFKPIPAQLSMGNGEMIDMEVFDSLPSDIRREIERELLRRGITLPSKQGASNGKAYLQQLLPSQLGAKPKYVRVRESPKRSPYKSPTKRQLSRPRTQLPTRKSEVYNDSDPFDSSIMNELPSSVRNDVLKDLEYKNKVRKYDLVPLRDKINKKHHESKPLVSEVTSDWLSSQKKLSKSPQFLNGASSYLSLKKEIALWVKTSLEQKGPHVDDVTLFTEYLQKLNSEHSFSRSVNRVKYLKTSLDYHEAMNNCSFERPNREFIAEGLRDWNCAYSSMILPLLFKICSYRDINLELD